MENVAVAGATLSSMLLGQGDGAPLLMLHGLATGNMATWYSGFAVPLSAQRRVLLYDQRGHGGSSTAASGFDLDTQADDLAAVIAHHRLQGPIDLIGHSMGALVALHFALRAPSQVARLILVDAPMPAQQFVAPSLANVSSPEALAAYAEQALAVPMQLGGRRRDKLLQRLNALFFESSLVADVQAMSAEPDTALVRLELPVLLVYGRRSPCLSAGLHLAQVLPVAQLVSLDCGHYIPEEAPQELLDVIKTFLEPSSQDRPALGPVPGSQAGALQRELAR